MGSASEKGGDAKSIAGMAGAAGNVSLDGALAAADTVVDNVRADHPVTSKSTSDCEPVKKLTPERSDLLSHPLFGKEKALCPLR